MKMPIPHCASTKHAQSDRGISFGYDLRCRRSSSDKIFFGRTDGQSNNNKPELSFESAGVMA